MPTKVLEIDFSKPLEVVNIPEPYRAALVFGKWGATPLGLVRVETVGSRLEPKTLESAARASFGWRMDRERVRERYDLKNESSVPPPRPKSVSVVIPTRDRAEDLRRCLDSLRLAAESGVEIIVVDNAPPNDSTRELVARYPVRYEVESRKGANWARSHGARVATGEIVLFTDDDLVVDAGWVDSLVQPFNDPCVGAVTGLVLPMELETEWQELFEAQGGFGHRFEPRRFSRANHEPLAAAHVGASANIAIRRKLIIDMALFDAELGPGTAAKTGEDHYAIFRLLREGHVMVYEPKAFSWHCHRRTEQEYLKQMYGYSVGVYCYLARSLFKHGETQAIRIGLGWFYDHHLKETWRALRRRKGAFPLSCTLTEIRGVLIAPLAYLKTLRDERQKLHGSAVGAPE